MYSRQVKGQILTLSASGWTYNNTFVLYDYETESLWYHFPGRNGLTCISGFYADNFLNERSSTFGRWSEWNSNNPNTLFLVSN